MNRNVDQNECQFVSLQGIAEGYDKTPPVSLIRHTKLFIRRHISPSHERNLYKQADAVIDKFFMFKGARNSTEDFVTNVKTSPLREGDLVRVRSKEKIKATLDHLGKLKGCSFMENEMSPYCGTVHRVHKSMERFVDERELKVKKCRGLILLQGVMCQGTTSFGRCDRSCFVFWREEWLEKIENQSSEMLEHEN